MTFRSYDNYSRVRSVFIRRVNVLRFIIRDYFVNRTPICAMFNDYYWSTYILARLSINLYVFDY